jgi:hypothetical protein
MQARLTMAATCDIALGAHIASSARSSGNMSGSSAAASCPRPPPTSRARACRPGSRAARAAAPRRTRAPRGRPAPGPR